MSAGALVKKMSIPEYLAFEEASKERHEYLRGEVYAMAGGTPEHGAIAAAVTIALGSALQGRPCRVFNSDVRVRCEETDLFTYPDVFVVCGKLERSVRDADSVTNPIVVVEVLSPSTESYDRGAKAQHYLRIPALREYVLVNHALRRVEVFRKNEAQRFEWFTFEEHDEAEFASLGVRIAVAGIYWDPLA
jgi:Uma2 family endonuclease